jgi:hypothetical protein
MMARGRNRIPQVLHNMSVPPTSRITVARVRLPGLRFGVDLASALGKNGDDLRRSLAKGTWRRVCSLVGPVLTEAMEKAWWLGQDVAEDMERHLLESLREAGVPDRPGVFLEPAEADPSLAPALPPAAALAVLARRSGPLYLPSRRLEPSLADPSRPVTFFALGPGVPVRGGRG